MKHPVLKSNPNLANIQTYIAEVIKFKGFDKETVQDSFIMMCEEVGELAKALRKSHGVKLATDSKNVEVRHEVADVFWMLVCICNQLGISLEAALREKEEYNKKRSWQ